MSGKVNGIVRQYLNAGYSPQAAMNEFEKDVENVLGITIDYNAVVWFGGLTTLVGKVDPIYVNSPEIRDGKLIDDHAQGQPQGVYFPSASSYPLYDYNTAQWAPVLQRRMAVRQSAYRRGEQVPPRAAVHAQPQGPEQQRLGALEAPAELHLRRNQCCLIE